MANKQNNIYIGCSYRIDQDTYKISNEMIHPIRCGACFDQINRNNIPGDNTGDNISNKRNSYCELTVQYWMWKNIQAEYYGLCHYRRMLSFSDIDYKANKRNQVIEEYLNEEICKKYVLDSINEMEDKITPYDIVSAKPYDVRKKESPKGFTNSVREFWKAHDNVLIYEKDIDFLEELIREYAAEYYDDAKEYLDGYMFLGYNCFIMNKELFNELCEYEFSILEAFEKRVDMTNYEDAMIRTPGFLGEILYSIFVYHKKKQEKYKLCERQLVFFKDTESAFFIQEQDRMREEERIPIVLIVDSLNPYVWNSCLKSLLDSLNKKYLYYITIFYRFLPMSLRVEWEEMLNSFKGVYYNFHNLNLIDFGKEKQYIRHFSIEVYIPWLFSKMSCLFVINQPCLFEQNFNIDELRSSKQESLFAVLYGEQNQIKFLNLKRIRQEINIDELYEKIPCNDVSWDKILDNNQLEYQFLNGCNLIQSDSNYAKEFYELKFSEKMNLKYPKGSRLRNDITKVLSRESLIGKIFKFDRG